MILSFEIMLEKVKSFQFSECYKFPASELFLSSQNLELENHRASHVTKMTLSLWETNMELTPKEDLSLHSIANYNRKMGK